MSSAMNYTGLVLIWSLVFSVLYLPFRYLTLKKDTTLFHEVGLWLFWISVVAVLSQTLTTDGTLGGIGFSLENLHNDYYYSFVPFRIFKRIADIREPAERFSFALVNVPGNILIFAPVGFAACWAFRWGLGRATLCGCLLSVFVELGQMFLPRTTDIDDVWMNTLGAFLGAAAWLIFRKINEKIVEVPDASQNSAETPAENAPSPEPAAEEHANKD